MALQKTWVPLTFQGVDTKTDEKTLPLGKLTALKNADITRAPTIEKRRGFEAMGTTDASAIYAYEDSAVTIESGNLKVWSNTGGWITRGTRDIFDTKSTLIEGSSLSAIVADLCFMGPYIVQAYIDSDYFLTWSVFDPVAGVFVVAPVRNVQAEWLRCIATDKAFWIFFKGRSTATLKCIAGVVENPAAATTVTHHTDADTYPIDACTFGANALCVYRTTVPSSKIFCVTPGNVIGSPSIGLPSAATLSQTHDVAVDVGIIMETPALRRYYAVLGVNQFLHFIEFDESFTEITTDSDDTGATIRRLGCIFDGTYIKAVFSHSGSTAQENYSGVVQWDRATTTVQQDRVFRGYVLSKPYLEDDGSLSIATHYTSNEALQPTGFIFRLSGDASSITSSVIGRFLPSIAGTSVFHAANNQNRTFAFTQIVRVGVVNPVRIEYAPNAIPAAIEVKKSLYFTGSFMTQFDGARFFELGFLLNPEQPLSATPAATGGSMSDGTYLYTIIYEYTDAEGNVHRSAPSTPLSVTVSGGGTAQKVTFSIQNLWHTLRKSGSSPVIIRVYRTAAGGTVYYLTSATALVNDPTTMNFTFVDTRADSSLITRELLYTTGGVVENIVPPGCVAIATYQDRVVVSGGDAGSKLYFSKPAVRGDAVSFSDLLVVELGAQGETTGLTEMDQTLVAFSRRKAMVLSGSPANALGTGSTLSAPAPVPADVGCIDQRSIVQVPSGVLFQSDKGIWKLDRGFTDSYSGAAVEDLLTTVQNAVLLSDKNKVIFSQAERALVFDYFYEYWSTYEVKSLACAASAATVYFLLDDGQVVRSYEGYADRGAPFSTVVESGWISLAGIQGFQRLYAISMLGERIGSHRLKVELMYDFSDAVKDTFSVSGDSVVTGTYGGTDAYGVETPFGGSEDGVYRFVVKPRIQKCSSFKFRISDEFPESAPSGGFKLTHIAIECGVIGGRAKFGSGRTLVGG